MFYFSFFHFVANILSAYEEFETGYENVILNSEENDVRLGRLKLFESL